MAAAAAAAAAASACAPNGILFHDTEAGGLVCKRKGEATFGEANEQFGGSGVAVSGDEMREERPASGPK